MFETVKNRRTIRKYLPKDINPSLLNDLLETSFRASTMGGMQLYSVIVTRDAETFACSFQSADGKKCSGRIDFLC